MESHFAVGTDCAQNSPGTLVLLVDGAVIEPDSGLAVAAADDPPVSNDFRRRGRLYGRFFLFVIGIAPGFLGRRGIERFALIWRIEQATERFCRRRSGQGNQRASKHQGQQSHVTTLSRLLSKCHSSPLMVSSSRPLRRPTP